MLLNNGNDFFIAKINMDGTYSELIIPELSKEFHPANILIFFFPSTKQLYIWIGKSVRNNLKRFIPKVKKGIFEDHPEFRMLRSYTIDQGNEDMRFLDALGINKDLLIQWLDNFDENKAEIVSEITDLRIERDKYIKMENYEKSLELTYKILSILDENKDVLDSEYFTQIKEEEQKTLDTLEIIKKDNEAIKAEVKKKAILLKEKLSQSKPVPDDVLEGYEIAKQLKMVYGKKLGGKIPGEIEGLISRAFSEYHHLVEKQKEIESKIKELSAQYYGALEGDDIANAEAHLRSILDILKESINIDLKIKWNNIENDFMAEKKARSEEAEKTEALVRTAKERLESLISELTDVNIPRPIENGDEILPLEERIGVLEEKLSQTVDVFGDLLEFENELSAELEKVKDVLRTKREEIAELKEQYLKIVTLGKERERLERAIKSLNSLEDLDEVASLISEYEEKIAEASLPEDSIKGFSDYLEELKADYRQLRDDLIGKRDLAEKLRRDAEDKEREGDLEGAIGALESLLSEDFSKVLSDSERTAIGDKIDGLKAELDAKKQEMEARKEEFDNKIRELEDLLKDAEMNGDYNAAIAYTEDIIELCRQSDEKAIENEYIKELSRLQDLKEKDEEKKRRLDEIIEWKDELIKNIRVLLDEEKLDDAWEKVGFLEEMLKDVKNIEPGYEDEDNWMKDIEKLGIELNNVAENIRKRKEKIDSIKMKFNEFIGKIDSWLKEGDVHNAEDALAELKGIIDSELPAEERSGLLDALEKRENELKKLRKKYGELFNRMKKRIEDDERSGRLQALIGNCERIIDLIEKYHFNEDPEIYRIKIKNARDKLEEQQKARLQHREMMIERAKQLENIIQFDDKLLPMIDEFDFSDMLGDIADIDEVSKKLESLLEEHRVEVKDEAQSNILIKTASGEVVEIEKTTKVKTEVNDADDSDDKSCPIAIHLESGIDNNMGDVIEEALIEDVIPYNFEIEEIEVEGADSEISPEEKVGPEGLEVLWRFNDIAPGQKVEILYKLRNRISRTIAITDREKVRIIKTHYGIKPLDKEGLYDAILDFRNKYGKELASIVIEDIVPIFYYYNVFKPKDKEYRANKIDIGSFLKWSFRFVKDNEEVLHEYRLFELFVVEYLKKKIHSLDKAGFDSLLNHEIDESIEKYGEILKLLGDYI